MTYQDRHRVLRQLLRACENHRWQLMSVESQRAIDAPSAGAWDVAVLMTISGTGVLRSTRVLATVDGVSSVKQLEDETE